MKKLPRARGPYAIDSGGFTELSLHGRWTIRVDEYVAQVRRFLDFIGKPVFVAQCDWMCEPQILARTGKTVEEHQHLTVSNYLELQAKAPEVPWMPVIQGWGIAEYWRCADMFEKAGVDLATLPAVGVGSVCRRQGATSIGIILATLAQSRYRLHAFGVKTRGLMFSSEHVVSADSLAWSLRARKRPPLPECEGEHVHCGNCLIYALRWRKKLLESLGMKDAPRAEPPVQRLHF